MTTPELLDHLMLIGDHFDDSFVIVDMIGPGRLCVHVNDKFFESTGYGVSETVGRNLAFLQGENTSAAAIQFMRNALDNCTACCIDLLNYRRDGTEFLNRLVILPIVCEGAGYFLGFQNVLASIGAGQLGHADISHGEINHMLNNPLTGLLLKVEMALVRRTSPEDALIACRDTFLRINRYCRNIDRPDAFSSYNLFRESGH